MKDSNYENLDSRHVGVPDEVFDELLENTEGSLEDIEATEDEIRDSVMDSLFADTDGVDRSDWVESFGSVDSFIVHKGVFMAMHRQDRLVREDNYENGDVYVGEDDSFDLFDDNEEVAEDSFEEVSFGFSENAEDIVQSTDGVNDSPVDTVGNSDSGDRSPLSDSNNTERDVSEGNPRGIKLSKRTRRRIIKGTVTILALGGVYLGGKHYISNQINVKNEEDLRTALSSFYTDETKTDIKENVKVSKVEKYLAKLDSMELADKDSLGSEFDTIISYLEDRDVVDKISASSYDLNSSGILESIDDVRRSVSEYSTVGLALSMSENVEKLSDDYGYYIALRDELSNYSDYINFDKQGYQLKVSNVTHTENKKELQKMVDTLYEAKQGAEKVAALEAQEDEDNRKAIEEYQAKLEAQLESARNELNTFKEETKGFFKILMEMLGFGKKDSTVTEEITVESTESETVEDSSSDFSGIIYWVKSLF